MPFDQEVPPSYKNFPPLTFNLVAYTASATALYEKLSSGLISKRDYDPQILPTTINAVIKLAFIPIIKTTDDDLTAILTQASYDEPTTSPPDKKKEKLYLCFSASLLGFIGLSAPVSRHSILLDPDRLKKILTFLKASHQTDQLLVAREDDVIRPEFLKMFVTHEECREGDTYAGMDSRPSSSSPGGRHG